MFIYRCSRCAPLVTLQMSTGCSNSCHVRRNCDTSTLAMACEIRSRISQRGCRSRGCYTRSFTYPHTSPYVEVARSKVRGCREPRHGSRSSYPSLLNSRRHFPLRVICGWYVIINVANVNLINFLAVFKLFHVCISNRFENTPISYNQNHL
jgi:hypothetical protein